MSAPLAGIVVADFTQALAGPFCTMIMGDWGAEVIKVEPPHGDQMRRYGPPFLKGEGAYFLSANRNKKSLLLDLKHPDGPAVARRLVAASDVVVENFRPPVMARWGLDYASLAPEMPRLVYCSVSSFGAEGPMADLPGYDQIVQGLSGFMSVTGTPESGPLRAGVPLSDLAAGLFAVLGVLLALRRRDATGRGGQVATSLFEALLGLLGFQAAAYCATGQAPGPTGNHHPLVCPYGTFAAADGHLNLAVGNQAMWLRFCEAMEAPEWAEDPRFADNESRLAHRPVLHAEIERRLARAPIAEWLERCRRRGVAAGPIADVKEALNLEQTADLGMLAEILHPTIGRMTDLAPPVRVAGHRGYQNAPPPLPGEHTREVLARLGYSAEEAARLQEEKVVG